MPAGLPAGTSSPDQRSRRALRLRCLQPPGVAAPRGSGSRASRSSASSPPDPGEQLERVHGLGTGRGPVRRELRRRRREAGRRACRPTGERRRLCDAAPVAKREGTVVRGGAAPRPGNRRVAVGRPVLVGGARHDQRGRRAGRDHPGRGRDRVGHRAVRGASGAPALRRALIRASAAPARSGRSGAGRATRPAPCRPSRTISAHPHREERTRPARSATSGSAAAPSTAGREYRRPG